jgi:TonB-dependent receptor
MKGRTQTLDRLDRSISGTKLVLLAGASSLALAAAPALAQTAGDPATASNAVQATDSSQQAAPATLSSSDNTQSGPEVIITGIRASLANAQNIKRNSNTIVDAITASDIGALPDRSVTEALQRVPGVTMNRFANASDPDHFSVEGNNVTIRGLTFVRSEFNGRDTFSAGIYGQAIDFSAVPAELLGSVEVYKNVTAAMIEGGLAGTVNLNTRVPLDNKGFHIAFDMEGNYGDMSKHWTPTYSAMISDTWETGIGTIGLLGDLSYSRIRSRADGIQVTNFQTRDGSVASFTANGAPLCRNALPTDQDTTTLPAPGNCGAPETPGSDGLADLSTDPRYAPLGGQFRTQEFDHRRIGAAFAAQWESLDHRAKLTAQYLRTESKQLNTEHTFESLPDISEYKTFPAGCIANGDSGIGGQVSGQPRTECPIGSLQNYSYDENGVFEKGYITMPGNGWASVGSGSATETTPTGGIQQSLAYDQEQQKGVNQDFGLNFKFNPNDHWSINLDADYTTAVTDDFAVDEYGSEFADEQLDLTGKIPTVIPHKPLTLAPSWGTASPVLLGETDSQYFNDPNEQFWRGAMDHLEHSTGHEWALKGDVAYNFNNDSFLKRISVGLRADKREETVRYSAYNWGALSEIWSGSSEAVTAAESGDYTRYTFPDFFRGQTQGPPGGFYYNGNLLSGYRQFEAFAANVQDLWVQGGTPQSTIAANGFHPLADRDGVIPGTSYLPSEIQKVSERNEDAYLMLDFGNVSLGGIKIEGNIGLRYVGMRTTSAGNVGAPTAQEAGTTLPYHGPIDPVTGLGTGQCDLIPPNPGAPAGTPPQPRGGLICTELTEQQYDNLQQFANGVTTPQLAIQNLHYFLPAFNLKLGLSRDFIVRFAASRVLTSPSLADIRDFLQTGFDQDTGQLTTQAGNPYLKPATADQFDLTAEWYFARVGSLTFDAFYKRLHNFFYSSVTDRQITNNGVTETLTVQGPANFPGTGTIKGFEVDYQQTFDFLPGFLKGFGTNLTYTYLQSKGVPNSFLLDGAPALQSTIPNGKLPLEQLSKHNINATLFYEKGPISLRAAYSWRSKFLLTARDYIYPRFPIYNAATGQLDASAFYSITKSIKLGVQGVNLTNTVTKTLQQFTITGLTAPRSYFMNDRRFSFIARANF